MYCTNNIGEKNSWIETSLPTVWILSINCTIHFETKASFTWWSNSVCFPNHHHHIITTDTDKSCRLSCKLFQVIVWGVRNYYCIVARLELGTFAFQLHSWKFCQQLLKWIEQRAFLVCKHRSTWFLLHGPVQSFKSSV